MPIIYSVVSRGLTVLAKYESCAGNFSEVTAQVLSNIPPHDSKLSYSHESYLFHYIREDDIIYMCITDDEFERSRAFLFLHEIKKIFLNMYGARAKTAIAYAMQGEFSAVLRTQMNLFGEGKNVDKIAKLHGDHEELRNIIVEVIDKATMRGERLELLVNKAENLSNNSGSFRQSSRVLQRSLFWKTVKCYVIMGAVGIVVLYFVMAMFCGGLSLSKCV